MKATAKFLRSKRYLNRYFVCMWTVCIGEDGKRIAGSMKKRLVKADSEIDKSMLRQLDRMKCPLRVTL